MKIKKRYLLLAFSLGLFGACQMDFLKFCDSDASQRRQLAEAGQTDVRFFTYEVAGRQMHYVHVGADSLPLVVLVHGSPGSSSNLLGYLADTLLTARAQVVAVDRPGFGQSGFGEAEPSLGRQAAALLPILEQHGQQGTALLLGHSYGGPVIARAAMDFPQLVGGLVIVAGSIDPALEPDHWFQKPLDWRAVRWVLPPALRVSNQEILPLPAELEEMLPHWDGVTCPVTVVQGMQDKLVGPENADFAKKMLTNSSRVRIDTIEGEGHFVLWSHQPRIVGKLIELLDFLAAGETEK